MIGLRRSQTGRSDQYAFDEASASAGKVERISAYEGSDLGSTV